MKTPVIVASLALALSGCSAVGSMTSTVGGWFGSGPAKAKPAELVNFKPTASLAEAWKAETGDAGGYLLRPQAEGADVLAAGGNRVVRVAIANGSTVWRTDTGAKLSAGAGAGQGLALAGGGKGELLALDLATGQQRWKVT
ncbi:MAG: PQQ-binding-like beta-propeller repeat protein, partial [Thiobacillus sp.]|nr:PQQ-binding-like beta-propeller repeat protein [Thiobacillus sp.]